MMKKYIGVAKYQKRSNFDTWKFVNEDYNDANT